MQGAAALRYVRGPYEDEERGGMVVLEAPELMWAVMGGDREAIGENVGRLCQTYELRLLDESSGALLRTLHCTPLTWVIFRGLRLGLNEQRRECLHHMLACGVDPNAPVRVRVTSWEEEPLPSPMRTENRLYGMAPQGHSPLYVALTIYDDRIGVHHEPEGVEVARMLLDHFARFDTALDGVGPVASAVAAHMQPLRILRLLHSFRWGLRLEDVLGVGPNGQTAMQMVCQRLFYFNAENVRLLQEMGASVRTPDPTTGRTPVQAMEARPGADPHVLAELRQLEWEEDAPDRRARTLWTHRALDRWLPMELQQRAATFLPHGTVDGLHVAARSAARARATVAAARAAQQ